MVNGIYQHFLHILIKNGIIKVIFLGDVFLPVKNSVGVGKSGDEKKVFQFYLIWWNRDRMGVEFVVILVGARKAFEFLTSVFGKILELLDLF